MNFQRDALALVSFCWKVACDFEKGGWVQMVIYGEGGVFL